MNPYPTYLSRSLLVVLASALGAPAAACTSGGDADEGESQNVVVNPKGNDNPGKLVVKMPDDVASLKMSPFPELQVTGAVSGTALKPDVEAPMRVGDAMLQLGSDHALTDMHVTIKPGATTTYRLSTATMTMPQAETVGLQLTSGGRGGDHNSVLFEQGPSFNLNNVTSVGFDDQGMTSPFLLPGKYKISFGHNDGMLLSVDSGKTMTVDLNDLSQRRSATLEMADRDEGFPDACPDESHVAIQEKDTSVMSPWTFALTDAMLRTKSILFGQIGSGTQHDYQLVFQCGGRTVLTAPLPLSGKAGDPSTPTKVLRLSVDDVALASGSTRPGRYEVFQLDDSGNRPRDPFVKGMPTHSGIDVPVGRYHITTEYTREDGQPGLFEQDQVLQ